MSCFSTSYFFCGFLCKFFPYSCLFQNKMGGLCVLQNALKRASILPLAIIEKSILRQPIAVCKCGYSMCFDSYRKLSLSMPKHVENNFHFSFSRCP